MDVQQIMEMLKAMQEKADADRKADQEKADAGQAEVIAAIERKTDAWIANIKIDREETTACHAEMESNPEKIEPDPGTMQSAEEHQEIPMEDAAVMPVGGLRKRRRVRNLAAEGRQKKKDRTLGNRGSRRKLTVAGKKMTRRATVAWRKMNVFRRKLVWKIRMQRNCGLRKDWTTDKVEREARRARMLRRRLRSRQENGQRIRDLGGRRPLYRRKRRPTKNDIGECKLRHRSPMGSRETRKTAIGEILRMNIAQQVAEIFRKTRKLEMDVRTARSTIEKQKIKKWTLWRGRPPPKRKKGRVRGKSRAMWDHRPLYELQPPFLCASE
jgi:hypothetical protein